MDLIEKNEVVQFKDGSFVLDVNVSSNGETVWLTLDQMSRLFNKNKSTISRHISNIFVEEELDEKSSVAKNATQLKRYDPRTKKDRIATVDINYYNLDVIISVGYRVKSKQGVLFRKWANSILKRYLLKGYVVNERHFQDIDYVTKMLDQYRNAGGKLPSSNSMLEFLKAYQRGFKILDDYDHHQLDVPVGQKDTFILHYNECMELIHHTMFENKGDLFSIERDDSFRSSISTIYQSFGRVDLYPTLEDKASALLYFIVKNHSFIDGNKRIGATIFLYFLEKNHALYKNGMERINNDALATLTILVASSRPEDKEIMMELIKTIIK
ncbi:death-on-curing protein [Coprobacillus sp. AF34-1BH]|nr:death-on-curing protein [Coprobacillus sp. AF18-40]RGT84877.1 death-on-curing protein [Coprobacillus sp. AF18-15LB]RHP22654.1 death-on-curing protein [Coprobacillus sp. AF34-1BH]RHQ83235.1 death-on-curing protein [Coprobacillus sp. AF21-8LB]